MTTLRPNFEDVQAHYDLSNDFYALFLDPTMTYSCAYFQRDDMTLSEAQVAKIDLSLGKCKLPRKGARPGDRLRLLDVGCGWGSTLMRAAHLYDVHGIGLTLSAAQHEMARDRAASVKDIEFRLQGWEEFDEPIDRLVTIGAFEHFRMERYDAFFRKFRRLLPDDGVMLVHSIVHGTAETLGADQFELTHELVLFMKFISREIFPGGQVPPREAIINAASRNGYSLGRVQSLRPHYRRTLMHWASNLSANRARAAALTSRDVVEKYLRYLTGCAEYFRSGHIDVCQFTFTPVSR